MNALLPTRRSAWGTFPTFEFDLDPFQNRIRRWFGEPMLEAEAMGWTPAVDVMEKDDELLLTAELPGLSEADVDIEVEGNVLTLKGEKEDELEKEAENDGRMMRIWERRYGGFTRSFTLPNTVDLQKIEAEFAKGVLTIHMPKTKETRGRHIEIKAS